MTTFMTDSTREPRLIGSSAATEAIRRDIASAAASDAKVLITGETGVGKDVIARLIHRRSARRHAPIATVNCAGVPDALIESELFGHVRGSFTDAYRDKAGILETANNGTVFLDEVGEMSPRMQAALLRFLETGEIQRVGSDRVHVRVNVRVIAATNRDLQARMAAGEFRQDLYYRLHVIHIHVPPLRERRADIVPLLTYFLEHYSGEYRVSSRDLSVAAQDLLAAGEWPGNVRQLKNAVERMVLKATGPVIDLRDIPAEIAGPPKAAAGGGLHDASAAKASRSGEPDPMRQMLEAGESFWSAVYGPFMNRDLSRSHVRAIVSAGLERGAGNYRIVLRLFNMPETDYKRFLNFLRKHECQVAHQAYRRPLSAPHATTWVDPVWRPHEPAIAM